MSVLDFASQGFPKILLEDKQLTMLTAIPWPAIPGDCQRADLLQNSTDLPLQPTHLVKDTLWGVDHRLKKIISS